MQQLLLRCNRFSCTFVSSDAPRRLQSIESLANLQSTSAEQELNCKKTLKYSELARPPPARGNGLMSNMFKPGSLSGDSQDGGRLLPLHLPDLVGKLRYILG